MFQPNQFKFHALSSKISSMTFYAGNNNADYLEQGLTLLNRYFNSTAELAYLSHFKIEIKT